MFARLLLGRADGQVELPVGADEPADAVARLRLEVLLKFLLHLRLELVVCGFLLCVVRLLLVLLFVGERRQSLRVRRDRRITRDWQAAGEEAVDRLDVLEDFPADAEVLDRQPGVFDRRLFRPRVGRNVADHLPVVRREPRRLDDLPELFVFGVVDGPVAEIREILLADRIAEIERVQMAERVRPFHQAGLVLVRLLPNHVASGGDLVLLFAELLDEGLALGRCLGQLVDLDLDLFLFLFGGAADAERGPADDHRNEHHGQREEDPEMVLGQFFLFHVVCDSLLNVRGRATAATITWRARRQRAGRSSAGHWSAPHRGGCRRRRHRRRRSGRRRGSARAR